MKNLLIILLAFSFMPIAAQERVRTKTKPSYEKVSSKKYSKAETLANYQRKLDSLKRLNINHEMQSKLERKISEINLVN